MTRAAHTPAKVFVVVLCANAAELPARAAAASGVPLDPKQLPQPIAQPHLIVIATPLVCAGETIAPESVRLTDSAGSRCAHGGAVPDAVRRASRTWSCLWRLPVRAFSHRHPRHPRRARLYRPMERRW
jgi:hypothetical protein